MDSSVLLVGHNVAFDMAVIAAAEPGLLPAIFAAYEHDRVTDTEIREKLIDIAKGRYRGFEEEDEDDEDGQRRFRKIKYSLEDCAERRLHRTLDKDTWRLRYGDLRPWPLASWPEGARAYPLEDAGATEDLFSLQEAEKHLLADQFRQARAGFWIRLMTNWGIRTSEEGVRELARRTRQEYEQIARDLRGEHQYEDGACKLCGAPNQPRPRHHLLLRYWEQQQRCPEGISVPLLKRDRIVERRSGEVETVPGARDTVAARARVVQAYQALGEKVPLTEKGQVALDRRTCAESRDLMLRKYAEFGVLSKILSTDLKFLGQGVRTPIHSHFEVCQDTGRTGSSRPNIQNPKRHGGIRECFVPRPGYVFAACDYSGAELCTLGQVCVTLFGRSALADAMNAGRDPHLLIASQILGRPYEELKRLHEEGAGPECTSTRGACSCSYCVVDNARQTGKVANFGFPGGLGCRTLVGFALDGYGVRITEQEARRLKRAWLAMLPEMRLYFKYIEHTIQCDEPIRQLFSDRFRGDKKYTVRCNTLFQGLAADMAKEAGWRISKSCYSEPASDLFGCRIVNFVHDEFILEAPEHRAHEAALEMSRHMLEAAKVWLPSVRIAAKPVLMRYWSKKAKAIYRDGRLVPWPDDVHASAA